MFTFHFKDPTLLFKWGFIYINRNVYFIVLCDLSALTFSYFPMCSMILNYDLIFSGDLNDVSCLTWGKTIPSKVILHSCFPAIYTCQLLGITSYAKISLEKWFSQNFLSILAGILFFLTHISHNVQPFWGSGLCRVFDFPLTVLQYLVSCPL